MPREYQEVCGAPVWIRAHQRALVPQTNYRIWRVQYKMKVNFNKERAPY